MKNRNKRIGEIRILLTLVCFTLPLIAAAETMLNGVVRDIHTQEPIAAAQISVINKKESAVTDEKGQFSIKVTSASDVLEVKAYDYNATQLAVRGRSTMVIDLYPDRFSNYYKPLQGIDGAMQPSTVNFSAKGLDDFGGSPALTVDEIIGGAMAGQVRGISRSGVSGMGSSLFIRGLQSLNANSQPLFVVDGIIWETLYDGGTPQGGFFLNTLDNLDVNDIENVTVIKDGTSIYGSKGANGVVLIKTKQAGSQVTKISLNTQWALTEKPGSVPMMNGDDYRLFVTDLYGSKGVSGSSVASMDYLITDPADPEYNRYHNTTNWNDEVYQRGSQGSYLINVMGGDDRAAVYFSLGFTSATGVIKTTDLTRVNARFNTDIKLMDDLQLGFNIGFTRTERSMEDDGINFYSSPTWLSKIKSPFMHPYNYSQTGTLTLDLDDSDAFGIGNPNAIIAASVNQTKKFRFNIGIHPVYSFNSNLTLGTHFDYSLLKSDERRFVPNLGTAPRWIENRGYSYNELNSMVGRNTALFDETRLTYTRDLDELGHLKAVYGFRYIFNMYEMDYVEEHNTGTDNKTTITGKYEYLKIAGINRETRSLSNFVQLDYDFDNRYYLTGVLAMDQSSRFGSATPVALFPALNGAWLVSSEPFMKHLDGISLLKLRAGIGVTGNDGIEDYQSKSYFTSIPFMKNTIGIVLGNLANNKLQWETTTRTNVGIDLGLMNEQVNLQVDLFNSNTNNLLVIKDAPVQSGLSSYWANSGSLNNKGIEASVQVKAVNTRDFSWEFGANVGHYRNQITALPEGEFTTSVYGGEIVSRVGEAAGTFYGYKALGVLKNTEEASTAYQPAGGTPTYLQMVNENGSISKFNPGDMKFEDVNGDGIIGEEDKQVIGNPNPDLYGSLTSTWKYGKLSLNALFTYSLGNDVYNYSRNLLESGKDFSNQTIVMNNRWTGENQTTDQPRAVWGDPMGNARFSDRWIEDGSYLRFKALTLSYDVTLKNAFLQGFKVWIQANNLFTITNYLGLDPEFSAGNSVYYQGVDAGLVPNTVGYSLGFKFNL